MKSRLFVLFLLATSTSAYAATAPAATPETAMACWDQTFAYNGFRVETTDNRLYATVKGSTLVVGENFFLWNNVDTLSLTNWDGSPNIIVSFDLKDCQIDESASLYSCTRGDLFIDEYNQALFVPQKVDHLGQLVSIISRYFAQKLTLSVSPSQFTLIKEQRAAGSGEVFTETLQILGGESNPLDCDSLSPWSHLFPEPVPAELVEYLE